MAVSLQSIILDGNRREFDLDIPVTSISHLGAGGSPLKVDDVDAEFLAKSTWPVTVRLQQAQASLLDLVLNPGGLIQFDEPQRGIRLVYSYPNGRAMVAYGQGALAVNRHGRPRFFDGGMPLLRNVPLWPVEKAPAFQAAAWKMGHDLATLGLLSIETQPLPPFGTAESADGQASAGSVLPLKYWGRDGGRPARITLAAACRVGTGPLTLSLRGKISSSAAYHTLAQVVVVAGTVNACELEEKFIVPWIRADIYNGGPDQATLDYYLSAWGE